MTTVTRTRALVRMFRELPPEEQQFVLDLTSYVIRSHRAPAVAKQLVNDVVEGKRGAEARLRAYRRQRRSERGGRAMKTTTTAEQSLVRAGASGARQKAGMAAMSLRAIVRASAAMCLVILGAIAPASAQSAQWLPGVDILVSAYTSVDAKTGVPGPIAAMIGFDRDTGRVSFLDISAVCTYPVGPWEPTEGKGAITHIFQIAPRQFALYHDSGYIRVERLPDALFCQPLDQPKAGG